MILNSKAYSDAIGIPRKYKRESKKLMKRNSNLNWVKRASNAKNKGSLNISLKNKLSASHLLSYGESDDSFIVYPMVVQKQGDAGLTMLGDWREAFEYARDTRSGIALPKNVYDKEFVDYFTSVGYKRDFPRKDYRKAKRKYILSNK